MRWDIASRSWRISSDKNGNDCHQRDIESNNMRDFSRDHSRNPSRSCFGKWPQDILARCICILALDRFGDFSGPTIGDASICNIEENGDTGELKVHGAAMVAPVREVSAQVISLLLGMAVVEQRGVVESCFQVLQMLFECDATWEVRHGAMLAFKYISAQVLENECEGDKMCIEGNLGAGNYSMGMKCMANQN